MSGSLKVGDFIPLSLLTENRATDRFVRARVKNSSGIEISGSPFNVPHLNDGAYWRYDVTMPDVDWVVVEYDVFEDAGFTEPSDDLLPVEEKFQKAELSSALDDIKAVVSQANMTGEVELDNTLSGELLNDEVSGSIAENPELEGEVQVDELTGFVDSGTELIGTIEEQ